MFKFVDLRDANAQVGDSRHVPLKDPEARRGFNVKYREFFSQQFAQHYGVADPRDSTRFLRLDELVDLGLVHEVWFFGSGHELDRYSGAYEIVEEKPQYDSKFRKVGDKWVQAGNGGDDDQPWTGRSLRIGFVNASRGVGCFLESLSHGMECTAKSGSIPYFTKYFREYADFNLKSRYGLPFDDLYELKYGEPVIEYPSERSAVFSFQGTKHSVENYVPAGGCAHFPPNARKHYDLSNGNPVLSTIEDWRIGSGPDGKDIAKPLTNQAFRGYRDLAPDCMGAWLVYWRQNMPALNSRQKDETGQPMKNWWPFLFY